MLKGKEKQGKNRRMWGWIVMNHYRNTGGKMHNDKRKHA